MGKHSAETEQKTSFKQLLGVLGSAKNAGRHSTPGHETASDVLEKTSRKPVAAAIAVPTLAAAAVVGVGVGSQQGGDDQVQASSAAVNADVKPMSNTKVAATKGHKLDGDKYKVTPASAKFDNPDDMGGGKTNSKASGKGGSCEASTYGAGDGTAGGPTASGETFDPSKMTAANKELPLGSVVKVTNKGNGKSVTVRINDRGPYVAGRCLDLSTAAMAKIAGAGEGTAQVTYSVQ